MSDTLKDLTQFLAELGLGTVAHTGKTYLGHLVAVHRYLQKQGCSEEVCQAGMFHSIYGTERFQGFKLSLDFRPTLQERIGLRAEQLAYLNCAMDRGSFDEAVARGTPPHRFRDRLTGEEVELNTPDFDDLCRIHLYDWLEQVPRARAWDYRRSAYRQLAERLGNAAVQEYDRVFAAAPLFEDDKVTLSPSQSSYEGL